MSRNNLLAFKAKLRFFKGLNQEMSPESEFIQAEIPAIERIVRDECWLEGERRGCPVDRNDPAIRARVVEIILTSVGAKLRSELNLRHNP